LPQARRTRGVKHGFACAFTWHLPLAWVLPLCRGLPRCVRANGVRGRAERSAFLLSSLRRLPALPPQVPSPTPIASRRLARVGRGERQRSRSVATLRIGPHIEPIWRASVPSAVLRVRPITRCSGLGGRQLRVAMELLSHWQPGWDHLVRAPSRGHALCSSGASPGDAVTEPSTAPGSYTPRLDRT
jgi:hypothetical protein